MRLAFGQLEQDRQTERVDQRMILVVWRPRERTMRPGSAMFFWHWQHADERGSMKC
jgi:hypothetical protein